MTSIISWINREDKNYPRIWTIGDTKISASQETLTLEGSKIFELHVKCKNTYSDDIEIQPIYYEKSFGFAFAGSSLAGLNSYATLSTILANLGGKEHQIPDIESIAIKAANVIQYYCQAICNPDNPFEALIFGYCDKTSSFKRFHILNSGDGNFEAIKLNDDVFLLGDRKEEIKKIILKEMERNNSKNYWRTPSIVLDKIIKEGDYTTIGGGTQKAIADSYGCKLYQSWSEKNEYDTKFRNIDLEFMGLDVGDCQISMDAISDSIDFFE